MQVTKKHFKDSSLVVIGTLTIVMISSLIISCNKRVSDNTQTTIESDSIVQKMSVLQDSLKTAWEEMIRDDDEKLGFMRRLLKEVSYSNYNLNRVEELNALVDELKSLRYDQKSMQSSALIDQYDSATSEVSRLVIEFVYDFPDIEESDLMNELISEINEKNNYVLIYRVHYDGFADEINLMIDKYGALLETKGVKVEKVPVFRIPIEDV